MKTVITTFLAVLLCGVALAQDLDPKDPFAKKPAVPAKSIVRPTLLPSSVLVTDLQHRQSEFRLLGVYQSGVRLRRVDGAIFFLKWEEFDGKNLKANNPAVVEWLKFAADEPGKPMTSGSVSVSAAWPREYSSKDTKRPLAISVRGAVKAPTMVILQCYRLTKVAGHVESRAVVLAPGKSTDLDIMFSASDSTLGEWVVRVWHENTLVKTIESSSGVSQKLSTTTEPGRVEMVLPVLDKN